MTACTVPQLNVYIRSVINQKLIEHYYLNPLKGKREVDKYFHYIFSCKHCDEYNRFTSCRVLTEIVDIDDPV